jgi:hypothetical protein
VVVWAEVIPAGVRPEELVVLVAAVPMAHPAGLEFLVKVIVVEIVLLMVDMEYLAVEAAPALLVTMVLLPQDQEVHPL